MKIHADLSQNAIVQTNDLTWQASPMPGVNRRMIERDGAEVARATSLVSYEAGSRFSEHLHDAGEEFLVMEGTFSDESGDFPKGSYVRNPVGSKHAPHSDKGSTIFVKLRQMLPEDQAYVRVDPATAKWQQINASIELLPLHKFGSENVALIRSSAEAPLWNQTFPRGLEILVIEGEISDEAQSYSARSWLRLAPNQSQNLKVSKNTRLFVKTGHLPTVTQIDSALSWDELLNTKRSEIN